MNIFAKSPQAVMDARVEAHSQAVEDVTPVAAGTYALKHTLVGIALVSARIASGALVEGDVERLAALTAAYRALSGRE